MKSDLEHKLVVAIERSQLAYSLYLTKKYYYQALRIHKANKEIYTLLTAYQYICSKATRESVFQYLFHLEDWFLQFEILKASNADATDIFVFERFQDSPSFPEKFVRLLNSQSQP